MSSHTLRRFIVYISGSIHLCLGYQCLSSGQTLGRIHEHGPGPCACDSLSRFVSPESEFEAVILSAVACRLFTVPALFSVHALSSQLGTWRTCFSCEVISS